MRRIPWLIQSCLFNTINIHLQAYISIACGTGNLILQVSDRSSRPLGWTIGNLCSIRNDGKADREDFAIKHAGRICDWSNVSALLVPAVMAYIHIKR